jgi:hypothetical protein
MRKLSGIGGSPTMKPQIQPLGGGLRDMVPAPRGIRAVGDGAWREDSVGDATALVGVMGFMCRPDTQFGMAGSTFSR